MKQLDFAFALAAFAAAAMSPAIFAPVNPFSDLTLVGFVFWVFAVIAITLSLVFRPR